MKVLFFGDIVGKPGRKAVAKILPMWKDKYEIDLTIANGENLAHGKGITTSTVQEILDAGVDVLTGGNHIFKKREGIPLLEDKKYPLLRPENFSADVPGRGHLTVDVGSKKVLILNLIGQVFFREDYESPFRAADRIVDQAEKKGIKHIIVDAHTEATSEKIALGWYLDGRVSAVIGTHTHVPTADARVLPGGTAHISDAGMCGPKDSILGVKKEIILSKFLTQINEPHEIAEGDVEVNGVMIEIDNQSGKASKIKRLSEIVAV